MQSKIEHKNTFHSANYHRRITLTSTDILCKKKIIQLAMISSSGDFLDTFPWNWVRNIEFTLSNARITPLFCIKLNKNVGQMNNEFLCNSLVGVFRQAFTETHILILYSIWGKNYLINPQKSSTFASTY